MKALMKKATLGAVLGATALSVAAPAEAQRWRRHRDNDVGVALAAGVAGIVIGSALTQDRWGPGWRGRGWDGGWNDPRWGWDPRWDYDPRFDYDRRFFRQRGFFPSDGYWARQNFNRFGGWNRCVVRRVWDPYSGRRVRVRYC
jgi:hypothetical protein